MKKIYLREMQLNNEHTDILIAEGETVSDLIKAADSWMLQRGMQRDRYSRFWCENGELFCDYGSWARYLIVTPYTAEEFTADFLSSSTVTTIDKTNKGKESPKPLN